MSSEVVYFDSSVLLSMLFAEESAEQALALWTQAKYRVSSLLLRFECTTVMHRVHINLPNSVRSKAAREHAAWLKASLGELALYELGDEVSHELWREPRYGGLRTLDAIHLATAKILISYGVDLRMATFDSRMREASDQLGILLASA